MWCGMVWWDVVWYGMVRCAVLCCAVLCCAVVWYGGLDLKQGGPFSNAVIVQSNLVST